MTHLKKYSEDIAKIACSGDLFGVMREMIDLSAAAAPSVRTAYSILHGLTLMIGAPRKSAASGLIPNANVQKNNTRPHLCGLFFCVNPPACSR